jgi:hypothetical protein
MKANYLYSLRNLDFRVAVIPTINAFVMFPVSFLQLSHT